MHFHAHTQKTLVTLSFQYEAQVSVLVKDRLCPPLPCYWPSPMFNGLRRGIYFYGFHCYTTVLLGPSVSNISPLLLSSSGMLRVASACVDC